MRKDEFPIVDKIREEAYRQGRADAIEEFLKILVNDIKEHHSITTDYGEMLETKYKALIMRMTDKAEQIKEQEG